MSIGMTIGMSISVTIGMAVGIHGILEQGVHHGGRTGSVGFEGIALGEQSRHGDVGFLPGEFLPVVHTLVVLGLLLLFVVVAHFVPGDFQPSHNEACHPITHYRFVVIDVGCGLTADLASLLEHVLDGFLEFRLEGSLQVVHSASVQDTH